MPDSLIIRSVTRSDSAQWEQLWESYNTFGGRSGAAALPDAITKMTWERFFDVYEPVNAIVAEIDGQLIGIVHYLFHRSTISIVPLCHLQDLFGVESARGLGVGRALIEAVYERAKSAGATQVYWRARDNNLTAMKLYDRIAERGGFIFYQKQI